MNHHAPEVGAERREVARMSDAVVAARNQAVVDAELQVAALAVGA